jgi:TRAP-type C4-dicarboxylate transport system permease large subunit
VKVADVIKDVAIILVPMLIALLLVILFPHTVLLLPRLVMPKFA